MTLLELLESGKPDAEIVEIVGYCLDEKADDSAHLENITLSQDEKTLSSSWWLYGSLLNDSAKEVLVRLEVPDITESLRRIGLLEYAAAVDRHDAFFIEEHLHTLGKALYSFIRSRKMAIEIDEYLDSQVDWLIQKKEEETGDNECVNIPETFFAKLRRFFAQTASEEDASSKH